MRGQLVCSDLIPSYHISQSHHHAEALCSHLDLLLAEGNRATGGRQGGWDYWGVLRPEERVTKQLGDRDSPLGVVLKTSLDGVQQVGIAKRGEVDLQNQRHF